MSKDEMHENKVRTPPTQTTTTLLHLATALGLPLEYFDVSPSAQCSLISDGRAVIMHGAGFELAHETVIMARVMRLAAHLNMPPRPGEPFGNALMASLAELSLGDLLGHYRLTTEPSASLLMGGSGVPTALATWDTLHGRPLEGPNAAQALLALWRGFGEWWRYEAPALRPESRLKPDRIMWAWITRGMLPHEDGWSDEETA